MELARIQRKTGATVLSLLIRLAGFAKKKINTWIYRQQGLLSYHLKFAKLLGFDMYRALGFYDRSVS